MSEASERCATCRFWQKSKTAGDQGWGFCLRYPPASGPRSDPNRWSATGNGDWCGEYRAREEQT